MTCDVWCKAAIRFDSDGYEDANDVDDDMAADDLDDESVEDDESGTGACLRPKLPGLRSSTTLRAFQIPSHSH